MLEPSKSKVITLGLSRQLRERIELECSIQREKLSPIVRYAIAKGVIRARAYPDALPLHPGQGVIQLGIKVSFWVEESWNNQRKLEADVRGLSRDEYLRRLIWMGLSRGE